LVGKTSCEETTGLKRESNNKTYLCSGIL